MPNGLGGVSGSVGVLEEASAGTCQESADMLISPSAQTGALPPLGPTQSASLVDIEGPKASKRSTHRVRGPRRRYVYRAQRRTENAPR